MPTVNIPMQQSAIMEGLVYVAKRSTGLLLNGVRFDYGQPIPPAALRNLPGYRLAQLIEGGYVEMKAPEGVAGVEGEGAGAGAGRQPVTAAAAVQTLKRR